MIDVAGTVIQEGDIVAVTRVGCPELRMAVVIGFSAQKVRVRLDPPYDYYEKKNEKNKIATKFSNQVAVVVIKHRGKLTTTGNKKAKLK